MIRYNTNEYSKQKIFKKTNVFVSNNYTKDISNYIFMNAARIFVADTSPPAEPRGV